MEWISVKEMLPDESTGPYVCWDGDDVSICTFGYSYFYEACFDDGQFDGIRKAYPTHWMPLPDPPEKERVCPECEGHGLVSRGQWDNNPDECPTCHGTGRLKPEGEEVCEWRCTDSDIGLYEGSCGAAWTFEEYPTHTYCPTCGKPIRLKEEEDTDD